MSSAASPPLVTGVDFVALPTHDLEAAAEFYGMTLGLTRSVYMLDRHFAEFETGNLTLIIIDAEATRSTPASATWRSSTTPMAMR